MSAFGSSPDKSRYRPCEVELHFSGKGVNEALPLDSC
jgi:hypothetical protein